MAGSGQQESGRVRCAGHSLDRVLALMALAAGAVSFPFRIATNAFEREKEREADTLAASQGKAEDVLLAVRNQAFKRIGLRVGYRLLEGGADNDEVCNFAMIHFIPAGTTVSFY